MQAESVVQTKGTAGGDENSAPPLPSVNSSGVTVTHSANAAHAVHAGSLATHLNKPASWRRSLSKRLSEDKCGRAISALRCVLLTALDVSKAVQFMHSWRFIHGDLKPHNILIANEPKVLFTAHMGTAHVP